ncbi:MAG TPA: glutathione S-transferase [Candidatus Binataceae bacterium]|nr:glutathione S-transferase [Candidatus Binataceae bacterium]
MLTVHHLNNSRSFRIVWLCEELGLDYKLVQHTRDKETLRAPDSLKKIHPLGKAPVIEHDGQTIAETDAIIHYICNKIAGGRLSHGPNSPEYSPYLEWLAYSEGTLMPGLGVDLITAWTNSGKELMGFFEPEIVKNHQYVENRLTGEDYILKSGFSAADINLTWTLEFSEARGRLRSLPKAQAYLKRMRERAAYKQTITRGGPQDLSVFSAGV